MPGIDEKHVNIADARLLYNDLRGRAEAVVEVSDSEPTNESNKIWIHQDETGEHSVPTVAEMNAAVAGLNDGKADVIVTSASGAVASFTDAIGEVPVENCIVTIMPTQSGTGDPSPSNVRPIIGVSGVNVWRTGKNLLNVNRTEASPNPTTISNETSPRIMDTTHYFVGIRSDNYYYKNYVPVASVSNGVVFVQSSNANDYGIGFPVCVKGGQKYTLSYTAENKMVSFGFYDSEWNYLSQDNSNLGTVPRTVTAPSGASYMVIVFRSSVGNTYTYSDIMLEVGESASEYTSYTGETCNFAFPVLSKNLLDPSHRVTTGNNAQYYRTGDKFLLNGGKTYTFSANVTPSQLTLFTANNAVVASTTSQTLTHTPTEDTYVWLDIYVANARLPEGGISAVYGQLELGDTAHQYEPYTKICYGGSLNVTTGLLTATHKAKVLNGSESWTGTTTKVLQINDMASGSFYEDPFTMCDTFKKVNVSTSGSLQILLGYSNHSIYVYNTSLLPDVSTLDDFKDWLEDNNVTITYPLATPVTFQLTPAQIATLLGQNNIFSDAGSTTVTYRANTKVYVDESIPYVPVQDVQINGTSILSQGVANVPYASTQTPGVIKVLDDYGAGVNGVGTYTGVIYIKKATDAQVKGGAQLYRTIVPANQDAATFYGLAKAAGTDMASSSNPVGTYTDAAKIAIQKMLGIYEAPWELIREDTFTNAEATEYVIQADSNGQSFELTDLIFEFWNSQAVNYILDNYGMVDLYTDDNNFITVECGSVTVTSGTYIRGCIVDAERVNGLTKILFARNQQTGNIQQLGVYFVSSTKYDNAIILSPISFKKIRIRKVQGTVTYKIYGKRKWT